MKRKIFSILSVLLVAALFASSASAGGSVGLSRVQFNIGSLIAKGTLTGLGGYNQGVTAELDAAGLPVVICTNPGGNQATGQNPPKVFANGKQFVGPKNILKNGTAPLDVETQPVHLTGTEGGCPNNNWSAEIASVQWTDAIIYVYDSRYYPNGGLLLKQVYTCDPSKQTATTASCTLVSETKY